MEKVRIGVIGVGNMGYWHIQYLHKNEIENAELAAVCDINPQKLEAARNITRADLPCFESAEELMKSGLCDAIISLFPIISIRLWLSPLLNTACTFLQKSPQAFIQNRFVK